MAGEIFYGDVGTVLQITVRQNGAALDISTASVKQLTFVKPNSSIVTKDAGFVTNGSDGKLKYTFAAGDVDSVGVWRAQVYLEMPSGRWHSDVTSFRVYDHLDAQPHA